MSYFLSNQNLTVGSPVTVSGEEAAHILLSRRIKSGEQILLQGPDGKRFLVEVVEASKKDLTVRALREAAVPGELSVKIFLIQSVVSEKALDFIFQKATELGASGIMLFNSSNTATKMSYDVFENKRERWNKILWEAAKQSDRSTIPVLAFQENLKSAMEAAKDFTNLFVLDIFGKNLMSSTTELGLVGTLGVVIGPEGGFTKAEVETLSLAPQAKLVSISPFTLRSETAAIAALSILQGKI